MSSNEWTPNETWEDALSRSKEIRSPSDVKPVKWSCNPERKWVHITESEWIGLHEAFHKQNKRLMALQDSFSDMHFEISQLLEKKRLDDPFSILKRWLMRLDKAQREIWPPVADINTEAP